MAVSIYSHAAPMVDDTSYDAITGVGATAGEALLDAACQYAQILDTDVSQEKVKDDVNTTVKTSQKSKLELGQPDVNVSMQCNITQVIKCPVSVEKCWIREQSAIALTQYNYKMVILGSQHKQRLSKTRSDYIDNRTGNPKPSKHHFDTQAIDDAPRCNINCIIFQLNRVGIEVSDIQVVTDDSAVQVSITVDPKHSPVTY